MQGFSVWSGKEAEFPGEEGTPTIFLGDGIPMEYRRNNYEKLAAFLESRPERHLRVAPEAWVHTEMCKFLLQEMNGWLVTLVTESLDFLSFTLRWAGLKDEDDLPDHIRICLYTKETLRNRKPSFIQFEQVVDNKITTVCSNAQKTVLTDAVDYSGLLPTERAEIPKEHADKIANVVKEELTKFGYRLAYPCVSMAFTTDGVSVTVRHTCTDLVWNVDKLVHDRSSSSDD